MEYHLDPKNTGQLISVEPTPYLRFVGGKLQQKFKTATWYGGTIVAEKFDWRDVPSEPA